jgi:phospholipid-transporting ATPase
VSASDYAIGQFKYLKNLLFFHGRESYRRNSYLVSYTFYKNVLFVMPQFWFGFYSAFSGQVFYEKWIFQIFNIVFTAFPIMFFALFDQEHTKRELMESPKLYKIGLKNQCFSTWLFWKWIIYGFSMSAVVFYISFVTFNESPTVEGELGDLWLMGTFAYGAIVIVANMTILYGSYSHTFISVFMIFASVAAYFVIIWLFSFLQISTLAD